MRGTSVMDDEVCARDSFITCYAYSHFISIINYIPEGSQVASDRDLTAVTARMTTVGP